MSKVYFKAVYFLKVQISASAHSCELWNE